LKSLRFPARWVRFGQNEWCRITSSFLAFVGSASVSAFGKHSSVPSRNSMMATSPEVK